MGRIPKGWGEDFLELFPACGVLTAVEGIL